MLAALAFRAEPPPLVLADKEWEAALDFCDRAQITLLLGTLDGDSFPEWVRERIEQNLRDNHARNQRYRTALVEICAALGRAGVEFVVLKGATQAPRFVPDLRFRLQSDIDLYCPGEQAQCAAEVLAQIGYEPAAAENAPVDHLPTMVQPHHWQWTGNWFDPHMPLAVDPHFRLWDEATEGFAAPGIEQFWQRRTTENALPVLDPADALAYCALHALRHWLRGSLKALHIYELAYFLQTHAEEEAFWARWRELHDPALRRLQAICFRLAAEWFGCRVPEEVEEEFAGLPPEIGLWFEKYAASPVEGLFRPQKQELWLHLSLLDRRRDRLRVLMRRLVPARVPQAIEAGCTAAMPRALSAARYAAYVVSRAVHHAAAVAPTLWQGWSWKHAGLGRTFWRFLGAASLFNFGWFVFFLLYNLHLLDRGWREQMLGWVAGIFTAGTVAAALPAGIVLQRMGLARTLRICFLGLAALSLVRTLAGSQPLLLGSAFCAGALFALYAVSIPPTVAALTDERMRPRGFSLVFGAGIGMGIVGGLVGGRLPGWLSLGGPLSAKQWALAAGCASMALAAAVARRLRFPAAPVRGRVVLPRGGFIVRFLGAVVVWALATGAFNPFFNAYFSQRLHASVERIGTLFAGSQFAQVVVVLLALAPGLAAAAPAYMAYAAFQYMSEPGLYTLLMSGVRPEEQGGASALNFMVLFGAQALAAAAAGVGVAHFSYPAVLGAAAAVAVAAAGMFRWLVRGRGQNT